MKILTVGRIAPVKNYEVLFEALKNVKNDFSLTIIGEPALKSDFVYFEKIKEIASPNTKFIGKINNIDLPDYYRTHDVFVHMSRTGSLDKTLLEAMACGMRVLSCNDAARAFLPRELMFANAEELADKIQKNTTIFDGRKYVLEHHDLSKLIARISKLL